MNFMYFQHIHKTGQCAKQINQHENITKYRIPEVQNTNAKYCGESTIQQSLQENS